MPPRDRPGDRGVLVTVNGTAKHCGPQCRFEGFDGWCSLFWVWVLLDFDGKDPRRHLRAKECREAEKRAGEAPARGERSGG